MSRAMLRRIDLSQLTWHEIELPATGPFTIGRGATSSLQIDSPNISRLHCRITRDGADRWLEDLSTGGIALEGVKIERPHRLRTGDALTLHDQLLVYVDRPEARHAGHEAAIAEDPEDPSRILVWADWLSEHGDPLGEDLVRARCGGAMLEGLQAQVELGRLELEWCHGLVRTARLRSIDGEGPPSWELLTRLVSVRACRWMRELVVDAAPLRSSSMSEDVAMAAALRVVIAGPPLPCLARLSFGYSSAGHEASGAANALVSSLKARFPRVDVSSLAPIGQHPSLEVTAPPRVDFHHHGPDQTSIPLNRGVWVGSASEGAIRAVAPGTVRQGVATCFIVRSESPQRCYLEAPEPGLRVNGHPAVPVRLLPGDVIEDSRGMRYQFRVA